MKNQREPEIVVLYCQNVLRPGERLGEGIRAAEGFRARFVSLPCSIKVEVYHLVKYLEAGVDGIQVVGCPAEHCRFLVGSTGAGDKIKYLQRLLHELNAGPARVSIFRGEGLSAEEILNLARERAEEVSALQAAEDGGAVPRLASGRR